MSWTGEYTRDASGRWAGTSVRFATKEEAEKWVADRAAKWNLVRATRVRECINPVNHRWTSEGAEEIK